MKEKDRNMAVVAYEKAIALGSPQSDILRFKADDLRGYIAEAKSFAKTEKLVIVGLVLAAIAVSWIVRKIFGIFAKRWGKQSASQRLGARRLILSLLRSLRLFCVGNYKHGAPMELSDGQRLGLSECRAVRGVREWFSVRVPGRLLSSIVMPNSTNQSSNLKTN